MSAFPLAAPLLALLTAAGQPAAPSDGPVQTAPAERPAAEPLPGLDEKAVEPPPGAQAADDTNTAPSAVAAAKSLTVEQKTKVQDGTLQVILGQRATFRIDGKGLPVLEKVEEGKLADAHPPGSVTETFEPPPEGQIAVALDGSAETRATILKVWNQTSRAIDYNAIALIMRRGAVAAERAPVCAVAAKSVRTETWPRPVVAVGLQRFKPTTITKACQ